MAIAGIDLKTTNSHVPVAAVGQAGRVENASWERLTPSAVGRIAQDGVALLRSTAPRCPTSPPGVWRASPLRCDFAAVARVERSRF